MMLNLCLHVLLLLPLGVASLSDNCTGLSTDPRHNIEVGHKGSGVWLHALELTDLQAAVFLGRADCVEELVADGAMNIDIDRALHMASRGVRDYLHKTHGAPRPPENELRRWLFLWRWAVKKRWCPVYEVLFRAGAVVRPDWRDDPYAFMVDEFRGPICGFTEGSGEL